MAKPGTDIMTTAFEWCATLDEAHVSEADSRALAAWLEADPSHREAFDRARRFWHELGGLGREQLDPAFFHPSWRERARAAMRGAVCRIRECMQCRQPMAVGSVAVICGLLVFAISHLTVDPGVAPVREAAHATRIGEVRTVRLDDGSSVTLGANTSIAATMDSHGRLVRMSEGEAFFEVERDTSRPFVVESGDLRITVHGTAFDIRRSELGARVAVTSGVVSVSSPQLADPDASAQYQTGDSATTSGISRVLTAGERLSLEADAPVRVESVRAEDVAPWRHNMLVYIDAPLAEIVADLNRYQRRSIRIRDESVGRIRLTATFHGNDIQGILATLTEALPVRLAHVGPDIELRSAP
ncbi:FecR family protein [Pseudodesulfovibrio alkaliphilus]|nr:FecR domain-containing protein [Pseudodesulfovibrio alkaliphilus]